MVPSGPEVRTWIISVLCYCLVLYTCIYSIWTGSLCTINCYKKSQSLVRCVACTEREYGYLLQVKSYKSPVQKSDSGTIHLWLNLIWTPTYFSQRSGKIWVSLSACFLYFCADWWISMILLSWEFSSADSIFSLSYFTTRRVSFSQSQWDGGEKRSTRKAFMLKITLKF